MRHRLVRGIVVAALAGLACAPRPWHAPTGIILVTLDTTRADRLPAYGFSGVETPALTRLARESVVFEHASTVAPLTLPAHCSLLTGLYPTRHWVRDNGGQLPDSIPTVAQVLRADGFRTAAAVGAVVLAADRGLKRGFDVYRDDMRDSILRANRRARPGAEVMNDALRWLDTVDRRERFFLWIHLYDAHELYHSPEPFATIYRDRPYLGGIASADAQVGRLLQELERRGLASTTAVIVAADHGESLGEHGENTHGLFVYESTLRVPLLMRIPGVRAKRVSDAVSLVDIAPTIFDFEGLLGPTRDGLSLTPVLWGRPIPDRLLYAESLYARRFGWSGLRVVRTGRFKLISAPRPELYDLERDPQELHDLYAERQALARALDRALPHDAAATPSVDPAVRERLASLGYASGPALSTAAGRQEDPKDHVDRYNAVMKRLLDDRN